MKLFEFLRRKERRPFGEDTDKSMVAGYQDVIIRSIIHKIGTGDLAEDCNGIDIYCQDNMYLESLPRIKNELLRKISSTREDLSGLIDGIKNNGLKVLDAPAPAGAIEVEGADVPIFFVVKRIHKAPTKLTFYDSGDVSKRNALCVVLPNSGNAEDERCFIGRNVPGSRHNTISLENPSVSRCQATVYWKKEGWFIQSECTHTWIGRIYLIPVREYPLPEKGVLYLDEQKGIQLWFVQEPAQ